MTEYYSNNIEHFEMVGGPCTTNPLTMSMATKQNCFPNQYPKNTITEIILKPTQEVRTEVRTEIRTESNIMMYLIVLTLISVISFGVWYFLMKKTE